MKKLSLSISIFSILLLFLIVFQSLQGKAETTVEFTYSITNGKCEITGATDQYVSNLTVPSSINGYMVTSIAANAFSGYSLLESITLPNTLTSIGKYAFNGCVRLKSISIPSGVTSIKEGTFYDCFRLNTVSLPNSVTTIGSKAFYRCANLENISIPSKVTSIGIRAFEGCTGIVEVTIPSSTTYLGECAFLDCASLERVTNLSQITSIEKGAFNGCSSLTNINIPLSVSIIGHSAFLGCISLTTIAIPQYVIQIGDYAFYGCSSLKDLVLPASISSIGNSAFGMTQSLTSIEYGGSQLSWNRISIGNNNTGLAYAKITYQKKDLTLVKSPEDSVVEEGQTVELAVDVQGDGLTYQWYFCKPTSDAFVKWSGRTKASINMTATSDYSGMKFYCEIRDQYGNVVNTPYFTLTVKKVLAITQQPVNSTAYAGNKTEISVAAYGDGLTYQWYYRYPGAVSYSKWVGKTSSILTFSASLEKNGIRVYCQVTDQYGNKVSSAPVTLTVRKNLVINSQPCNVEVELGQIAYFNLSADGDDLTYQWYYCLSGSTSFKCWNGRVDSNFYYKPTADKNGMRLYCLITDKYGNTIKTESITLQVLSPLEILQQPSNVSVTVGNMASFQVVATGDGIQYQWFFRTKGASSFSKWVGKNQAGFTYVPSLSKDGMEIYCQITDERGGILKTNTVTLSVTELWTPITITRQPRDLTVAIGDYAYFSMEATGSDLTYQWYYRASGSNTFTIWSGRTLPSFSYLPNNAKNEMQFYCKVTDSKGLSVNSDIITLKVINILITNQPTILSSVNGSSVQFYVEASGDNLTYQWYYKSEGVTSFSRWSGRTKSEFNFMPSPSQNGMQVYCLISDSYGNSIPSKIISVSVQ